MYKKLAAEIPNLRIANCFAHVRCKFVDAQDDYAEQAGAALDLIAEL